MPRFQATLRYVGTPYHGFQTQPEHVTVQETFEKTLYRILREDIRVTPSGRTDTGVHALAQVVHFDVQDALALERLRDTAIVYKINCLLPDSISVLDLRTADPTFHARLSALHKTYAYWILQASEPDPFFQDRAWTLPLKLDHAAMQQAAQHLIGEHDFSSFCAADSNASEKTRRLMSIKFDTRPPAPFFAVGQQDWLCVEFTGNGFLKQMVRNIVGTLVEVGRGKRSADSLKTVLAARDRTQAAMTAPACGLYLKQVDYKKENPLLPKTSSQS